jgi:ribosomal protein L1
VDTTLRLVQYIATVRTTRKFGSEVEVILQLKDLYFEVETERVRGKIELSLDRPVEEVPWI